MTCILPWSCMEAGTACLRAAGRAASTADARGSVRARGQFDLGEILASRAKHDFVRANGADHVFDYRTPGWSSSVRELVGDRGVDLFLDSMLWPMIEKNITLRGFNLWGCAEHFPRALGQIFDWAILLIP